jgi:hypothetical protein
MPTKAKKNARNLTGKVLKKKRSERGAQQNMRKGEGNAMEECRTEILTVNDKLT